MKGQPASQQSNKNMTDRPTQHHGPEALRDGLGRIRYVTRGDLLCMVDLEKRSCTCKQYDIDKIPCEHAIKVAKSQKIVEATLVDPTYIKGYLVAAYTEPINPTDEDLIPPVDVLTQVCLPPKIGKQRGRPKMKRYLSAIEKAKRFKRKLFKKKNETMSTSNPPLATPEGNQSSHNTSTKKRGRNQAPRTPIRQKRTNITRRTSSRKKPKYSANITAPTTPSPRGVLNGNAKVDHLPITFTLAEKV
ncbi:hypothetical protein F2Q70_00031830 [Brassica cretica]|uniref:SWIM-type domain-containing protein n=1 Tax=Brassica cretica TaxID=69181 RepID=A0A8S9FSF9_BRACR|nr:hypothetical protein F2Q70_00031830 [Brassica cretica]